MIYFAYAAFLTGTAALALPVILHFMRKKPEITEYFPSFMFLGNSIAKLHSRNNLRRLLVLLLRCLAFILISLAFAWPYMQDYNKDPDTATALLYDNSFSMTAAPLKNIPEQKALEILSKTDSRNPAAVALVSQTVKWNGHFTSDASQLKSFLKNAGDKGSSSFENALRQADMKLQTVSAKQKKIIIVSDRQAQPWRNTDLQTALSPGIELDFISPEETVISNAGISRAAAEGRFSKEASQLQISAETVNYSAKTFEAQIILKAGGEVADSKIFKLSPFSSETIKLKLKIEGRQLPLPCSVELVADDDIKTDNVRYFAINALPVPELVIDPAGAEEDYIRTSFAPEKNLTAAECRTPGSDCSGASMTIIRDGLKTSSASFKALKEYIDNGGTAVFLWKDTALMRETLRYFGVTAANRIRKERRTLSEIDFDHPLFKKFREAGTGSLFETGFKNTPVLNIPENANVPASFADGQPLILELPCGQGKIFVIASGLLKKDSDWPLSPGFLVFWREMLNYTAKSDINAALTSELESVKTSTLKIEGFKTDRYGNHPVTIAGKPYILSVNPPAEESDTINLPAKYQWKQLVNKEKASAGDTSPTPGDSTKDYWKLLLVLGLLCITTELLISNRTAL